jgi:single-stranded-DNA-specific exonuclease
LVAFSARAPEGYSIVDSLNSCNPDLFLGFGGHSGAGGFLAKKENIKNIEQSLESYFKKTPKQEPLIQREVIITPELLNFELIDFLNNMAPFGIGNPSPILCLKNVEIKTKTLLGKEKTHLKINGIIEEKNVEFIGFFWGEYFEKIRTGEQYNICFTVSANTWKGQRRLQLKLIDMKLIMS